MQKINYFQNAASIFQKLMEIETMAKNASIERPLIHLVKTRASQINGCLFCVDMHSKEAKIDGEKELRMYHLPVWRESPLFTVREKAALMWTEAVTKLSQHEVSDETFAKVKEHFSDKEMTDLTMLIGMINLWNRFGAPFASVPGSMDKMMGLEKAGLHA